MAYVSATYASGTDGLGSVASFIPGEWPSAEDQASGDYLLVIASNDGGGTALGISAGWTLIGPDPPNNSNNRTGVWYQKHTGTEITEPTLTGSLDEWACICLVIKDADGTTFLDATEAITNITVSTLTPTCPTITTATDNALILRIVSMDGSNSIYPSGIIGPGAYVAAHHDELTSTASDCLIYVDYETVASPGASGTRAYEAYTSEGGSAITLAIRNASGGRVKPYAATAPFGEAFDLMPVTTGTLLSTWHATINGITVRDGTTTGGAIRTAASVLATSYTLLGMRGWVRSIGQQQTANTGLAGIYGAALALPAAVDYSNALFVANILFQVRSSAVSDAGPFLYFRDSSGGWAVIRPLNEAKANNTAFNAMCMFLPSETIVDGAGPIDWSSITHIGSAFHILATVTSTSNRELMFRPILRVPLSGGAMPVVGGTSDKPFDLRDVTLVMTGELGYKLPSLQGAKQNLVHLPVQIGDGGTTPTHFSGNATAFEFAGLDLTNIRYRADDLEFRIKLGATDSFKLGAASIGSGLRQRFTVDPSSSTSATYDFGGTIFGMSVTLIDGIAIAGCTFAGCAEIDAQTATITGCTINGTTSTDAAIAFDGNGTIIGTVLDVTGTGAAYHLELGADVTAFMLTDCTFTGTPGTNKIHVKATSGTVTITATGLTSSDVTSDGATVSVVSGATLTVTGVQTGSDVVWMTTAEPDGSGSNVLETDDAIAGTSASYTYTSGTFVNIGVYKAGFLPLLIKGVPLSGTDTTIPVSQQTDRNYAA